MSSLRIVAGKLKGRRIPVATDASLRPTGDRVREALFNILGQDLSGFEVLDLFAGTGALGFEALSRNARRVAFVEANPRLAAELRRTAEALGVDREARIIVGRAEDVLDRRRLGGPFEVIVADPPYNDSSMATLVERIDEAQLLGMHGKLVIERESRSKPVPGTGGLMLRRTTSYGRASLDFYNY
jgi:16S rRNA (guanine(966)-N(2))-methyltransferase RsmD